MVVKEQLRHENAAVGTSFYPRIYPSMRFFLALTEKLKRYSFNFWGTQKASVATLLALILMGLGIPGLCSTDDTMRAAQERLKSLRFGPGGMSSVHPLGPRSPGSFMPSSPALNSYTAQSGVTSYSWGAGGSCTASGCTTAAAQWQSSNQWGSGHASTQYRYPAVSSRWPGCYVIFQPVGWNFSSPSGHAYSERSRYGPVPALPIGARALKKVTTWEAPDATDKEFKQRIQQSEIDNGPDDAATVALIINAARYYVENRQWEKADKMVKRLEKLKVETPEVPTLRRAIATGTQPIAPSKYRIFSPISPAGAVGWKPVTLQQPSDFRSMFPPSR